MIRVASKERIDRLFKYGYGLLRLGKISLIKKYNYKFSLPIIYIETFPKINRG